MEYDDMQTLEKRPSEFQLNQFNAHWQASKSTSILYIHLVQDQFMFMCQPTQLLNHTGVWIVKQL